MTPIEVMFRALFLHTGRKVTDRRYPAYGVVDAHTGEVMSIWHTRSQAEAAKGLHHGLRVRGLREADIPKKFHRKPKKKAKAKKEKES